jgi:hypothetical protein
MFIPFPESQVVVKGIEEIRIPELAHMRQIYESDYIADLKGHLLNQMNAVVDCPGMLAGKRLAITVGSRGIPNLDLIVRTLCDRLKEWGALPFIVPAMGSHGSGTAEGQIDYLKGFNITEKTMKVPILSTMDVVHYGTLTDGTHCYCDKYAYESDGIIVLNKIKPHSEFKGTYESGLAKMIAIGLGNHIGASEFHAPGFETFAKRLPEVVELFLKKCKCLFGIGIVQNAYDEVSELEVIRPENILERERALLEIAKRRIATFKGKQIDVLVIDEIGKNISGAGHDPNVTGRNSSQLPGFGSEILDLKRLFVRGLTKESHHNASGLGMADVTTLRCLRDVDWGATWTNLLNATQLRSAMMPLYMNNDFDALMIAIRTLNGVDYNQAKIVRIRNTQCMDDILVSRSYWESICNRPDVELVSDFVQMQFDEAGNLYG